MASPRSSEPDLVPHETGNPTPICYPQPNPGLILYSFGPGSQVSIDMEARRIFLVGEVLESWTSVVIPALLDMASSDEDIEVYLASLGGDLPVALAIADLLIILSKHAMVRTIAVGEIASASTIILAVGKERLITPSANVMVHKPVYIFEGSVEGGKQRVINVQSVWDRYMKLLTAYSSKPVKYWKTTMDKKEEFWMTAEETIKHGLADRILGKKA